MGTWLILLIHLTIHFSLFCSKTGAAISTSSNQTDRLALLAFKAKITHDPFGIMSQWNDNIDLCQWYGVACSIRHQRVTELNLLSLKLSGSISPSIGNLSFLRILQLENNTFIHQIPPEIGRLRRLQVLNLRNNSLGGEIPINLTSCSSLRILKLTYNNLEKDIPSEVGLLSNLQYFGLSMNNLTGSLPPSLGNLTSLELLGVENNNLVGTIPQTLGNLNQLRFLSLGLNYLSGEVPSSVFNLTFLGLMDIGVNQLKGHLPPQLFYTLPNLYVFSVGKNQFTGPIPVSLSNASSLTVLQLSQNRFTGNVPSLESLNLVRIITLFGNQLGNGIGGEDDLKFICSLTNATGLVRLAIQDNNLGGKLPSCITNLSFELADLVMFGNFISGNIPLNIGNLTGLQVLSVAENLFTGSIPPSIGSLENLVQIEFEGNNLSGSIPSSLGRLSQLNELDLSSNSLEGTIPSSLGNCTFLQTLNLGQNNLTGSIPPQILVIPSLSISLSVSQNKLTGFIPEEVGKLTNLYLLDLSANMLYGKIPESLGNCMSLQYLYLYGNKLQGPIPSSLSSMKGLQALDVANNNLSGQIPEFLASFVDLTMLNLSYNDLEGAVPKTGVFKNSSATSLQGNTKLCGGILDFHLPECIVFTKRTRRHLSFKSKVIVGIVAGFAGVAFLIFLLFILVSRRKQKKTQEENVVLSSGNQQVQFVSYGDLHRTTNGFSQGNLVGTGSFGYVYRGSIGENGQVVAIKVLKLERIGASRSFIAECEALRNIRHRNLVKLLTVCSGVDYQGNEFKALVYEFMSNGSLEDWLHLTTPRELSLLKRLNIAIDVASLLEYVHHQFGTPLVHCDIKPSNILLNDDLSGHVSDFGLAKFLSDTGIIRSSDDPSSSLGVRGTVGYAPPEYGLGSEVSTQGDVYSYGILLLEMFTGRRPTDEMFKEGLSLHLYAKTALTSTIVEVLDPFVKDCLESADHGRVMDCLVTVIEIGVSCSAELPLERMDMRNVSSKLRKVQEKLLAGRN